MSLLGRHASLNSFSCKQVSRHVCLFTGVLHRLDILLNLPFIAMVLFLIHKLITNTNKQYLVFFTSEFVLNILLSNKARIVPFLRMDRRNMAELLLKRRKTPNQLINQSIN
jgi:hypothetical protein